MEIMGLPLHPLIIHLTVVLVPLAALGGVGIAVFTWARKRYGSLVVVGAFVAAVSTYVSQIAGQSLYNSLPQHSPQLEAHASIGGQLLLWVILLFVGTVVLMLAQRQLDADKPQRQDRADPRHRDHHRDVDRELGAGDADRARRGGRGLGLRSRRAAQPSWLQTAATTTISSKPTSTPETIRRRVRGSTGPG